jgi:putative ubiquitin-RnfH superfamily antitoxin RatB of RatAB toxin-antitoxin module
MAETISISVVYALSERQDIVELDVPQGTTVEQAVELSKLQARFPEIGTRPVQCAIFSRLVKANDVLVEGDRVEILRPLLIDPKESRRQAAARSRTLKR